jgi:hypothetical protein
MVAPKMRSLLVGVLLVEIVSAKGGASSHLNLMRDHCTTMAIGKLATADGSTMATDTNDCHDCDWRFSKVPARFRLIFMLNIG